MKSIYSIVGMRFRGTEGIVAAMPAGSPLRLVRDPTNEHDPNAVEVWRGNAVMIGFIKGTDAKSLARDMDLAGKTEIAGRYVASRWPEVEVEM